MARQRTSVSALEAVAPPADRLRAWASAMAGPGRQAAAALVLLLLWQGLSTFAFTPSLLPSPALVVGRAIELTVTGDLPRHMATSLGRILVGYGIGSALGIVAGVAIGRLPMLEELVRPTFGFIRSIPPIAFVPFSIILFGIGEASKYAIIVYLAFIVVTLNTAAGVRETPRIRLRAAQALGAGERTILVKVILPSAFPFILTGLQVALGLSFMAVVSAELIAASSGLGYLIMDSQTMLETDKMLVGILCLGILGALVDRGSNRLTARLLRRYTQQAG
jgi:ABC-type nitrate/sulfonate/bicarbonate transport system permease component